jgi:ketosteroid isomerase-like protein
MSAQPSPSSPRQIVEAFFARLGTEGDVEGWLDLLGDDIAVDTPFAPTGDARRYEGREAVERRFGDARRRMPALEFLDLEILATEDPHRWVATCRSEGQMATGAPYQNRYCWILRVRDGRIDHWTEYFDPQEVLAVRPPPAT